MGARSFALLMLFCVLGVCPAATAQQLPVSEQVDAYLERLGLTDLRTLQLEEELKGLQSKADRLKTGRKLADLYIALLLKTADAKQSDEIVSRIAELLKLVPQVNSASLQTMLLQAEYGRAEALAAKWVADAAETDSRADAHKRFADLAPRLRKLVDDLTKTVVAEEVKTERITDPNKLAAKDKEITRLYQVVARGKFYTAWTLYYLASTGTVVVQNDVTAARRLFREQLGIKDDADYLQLDPESLALSSPVRSRLLLGLALCESLRGRLNDAEQVLLLFDHDSVPESIRDELLFWKAWILLRAGAVTGVRDFYQQQSELFPQGATSGRVNLCVLLIKSGYGTAPDGQRRNDRSLGMLGVQGLVKLGQIGLLRQLIGKYDISASAESGFLLQWLAAQELLAKAEQSKAAGDYRLAAVALERALKQPDAKQQEAMAAECRYALGWCRYRLKDYPGASDEFRKSAAELKRFKSSTAADAAWMLYLTYKRLADNDPNAKKSAAETLKSLKRDFPNHKVARQAEAQLAKLNSSTQTLEEALLAIKNIPPDSPEYVDAQFDLCVQLHRRWSKARSSPKQTLSDLRLNVERFLEISAEFPDADRKVKALLLVADAALGSRPADAELARNFLDLCDQFADELKPGKPSAAAYHYRRLQLEQTTGNAKAAKKHADWLSKHGGNAQYVSASLIIQARAADKAVKSAQGAEKTSRQREAKEIYAKLVAAMGDSPEVLRAKKNARIASVKLAEYQTALGRHQAAADRFDSILEAYPKDAGYLRKSGLAHYNAGNDKASLERWRKLTRGLRSGSDQWYDAKYYQLRCLLKTDRKQARIVFRQFKLLHPKMGGREWEGRFRSLEDLLGT